MPLLYSPIQKKYSIDVNRHAPILIVECIIHGSYTLNSNSHWKVALYRPKIAPLSWEQGHGPPPKQVVPVTTLHPRLLRATLECTRGPLKGRKWTPAVTKALDGRDACRGCRPSPGCSPHRRPAATSRSFYGVARPAIRGEGFSGRCRDDDAASVPASHRPPVCKRSGWDCVCIISFVFALCCV